MKDFTSRQLRAFLLVAQHRSFSRAAGALFITPSGLSVLIRELETQLGARLFDRTTRHVALTASGSELLAVAQRNLLELDLAMSRVGRSASETALSLSIGAPPLLMASIVAPAIKEFRSHRPELRFQLFDGDTAATMQKVESGELDMGLGVFFKNLPGVRRTPLFRFSLALIRADKDPTFRPATTAWSALKGERLISLPRSLPIQQFVDKHLARAGVVYQPTLVVNYLNTQIAMVEVGEGMAIIPSYGQLACRDRRVVMSRLVNPVVHVDACQVRRAGRKLPPIAEEFTSFLQSHLAGWAGRSGIL
jgi:LysR family transcriptional regulator, carnitine catabolism transcriptional activator